MNASYATSSAAAAATTGTPKKGILKYKKNSDQIQSNSLTNETDNYKK